MIDFKNIQCVVHNNKLVANVKGVEALMDDAASTAGKATVATKAWEDTKPDLRKNAVNVIDLLAQLNTQVSTVNFLGSEGRFIEVATSSRRKGVDGEALEQADKLQKGLGTELLTEELELNIKGELAKWVLQELEKLNQSMHPELSVKRRKVLVPKFEEVKRNMRASKAIDPSLVQIAEVLASAGIFAPSVEVKTAKVK